MTTTELLETVRRVEVRTNRLVNDVMVDAAWTAGGLMLLNSVSFEANAVHHA